MFGLILAAWRVALGGKAIAATLSNMFDAVCRFLVETFSTDYEKHNYAGVGDLPGHQG